MAQSKEERVMRQALRLAPRGQGYVEPNPMVGCVITRQGKVLGMGYHARFGGAHAEVAALQDCQRQGNDPAGADVFVTLEPCCHHGKTPPCTEALIAAGVGRVFVAMVDPFLPVRGKGISALEAAGIEVVVGVCQAAAATLNEPFVKRVTTGQPWVIAKWAQTLDGRIATRTGESKWISNERSRRVVHQLRARVDVVMTGIGTVLADDPLLTARDVKVKRVARRVVVDPDIRLPLTCRVLGTLAEAPLTVAVRQGIAQSAAADALRKRGVEIFGLPNDVAEPARMALAPLLTHLAGHHQATNVLVEGGATLMGTLLRQNLVDEIMAFVAPTVAGDAQAVGAVLGGHLENMRQAQRLQLRTARRIDDDIALNYRVRVQKPDEQGEGPGI